MHPLVSPAWLFDHLQDPTVLILDATLPPPGVLPPPDVHGRFLETHLPGAVFFDIDQISDASSSLPHTLPSPAGFSRSMAALGIPRDSTLVVYEQVPIFSAPRARWMLRLFGAPRVFLLDGGLPFWLEAGYPTQSGAVIRPPATFEASLNPAALKHLSDIQQLIAAHAEILHLQVAPPEISLPEIPVPEIFLLEIPLPEVSFPESPNAQNPRPQIVDARSTARFNGTAPEPRAGLPSGHMPGATSIPYTTLVEHGSLKPVDQLAQIFADSRLDLSQPITTTCGSGVTAAVVALALELCGASEVSLYDGSWAEYAGQPDARIVTQIITQPVKPDPTA